MLQNVVPIVSMKFFEYKYSLVFWTSKWNFIHVLWKPRGTTSKKTVSYIVEVLYMDRLSIINLLLLLKLKCWSYLSRGRSAGQIYRIAVNHNSYLQRPVCTVHRISSTADKNVFLYKQLRYYFDVCVVHFNMFLLWMIVPVLRLDDYI